MTTYPARTAPGILADGHRNRDNFLITLKRLAAWPFVRWYDLITGRKKAAMIAAALVPPAVLGGIGVGIDRFVYTGSLNGIVSTSHSAASLGQVNITDGSVTDAGMLIKVQFTPMDGGPRKYALLQGEPKVLWTLSGDHKMVMRARIVSEIGEAVALVQAENDAANDKVLTLSDPGFVSNFNAVQEAAEGYDIQAKAKAHSLHQNHTSPYITHFRGQNNFLRLGNPRRVGLDLYFDVIMDMKPKSGENTPAFAIDLARSFLQATQITDRVFLAAVGELPAQKTEGPTAFAGPQHFIDGNRVAEIYGQKPDAIRSANMIDTVLHNSATSTAAAIGIAVSLAVCASGSRRR